MAKFQTFDGIKLAYRDEGEGLPVLCLSGLSRNSSDFDYVAPLLDGVRLIRLDYRGRGASDWADPATYSVLTEGRDALALLDHLGVEKAAILGTSRGGLIAMALAVGAKDRLIGACLNDIGPEIAPEGLAMIGSYLGKNPGQNNYGDAAKARARFMEGFVNVPESRWMEEVKKHFRLTDEGLVINYDPALVRVFEPSGDVEPPNIWDWYDALSGLPVALLRGANSNILSAETAAEMQRRRPDLIYAEVPDRGHVPFLDEPDSVSVIRRWLEACR